MPQYQGVWNLQDAARLQSQQQWVTDPNFRNTTLLLQADNAAGGAQNNTFLDSSSNSFAITRNGNTTQGTFTPFSQGWSNYFDGSGDNLVTPSNSAFDPSGSNITVDCFIYLTRYPNANNIVFEVGASTAGDMQCNIINTGEVRFSVGGSVGSVISGFTLNTWHYITCVKSGTNFTVYLNGIAGTTVSLSVNSRTTMYIGSQSGGNNIDGYISNFRFVKGSANVPSGVPTAPLTNITNTSLLTCQSNRFIDNGTANSGSGFALTVNGNVSVQPFVPFAPQFQYTQSGIGGSGYFDGTGDYLSVASATPLTFGTGDFTVEGWFNAGALGGQPALLNNGSDAGGLVITFLSAKIYAYFVGAGNVFGSGGATLVTNTWYHFAWVRSGSTHTFYINGTAYGSTYSSAGNHSSTGGAGIGYSVAGSVFAAFTGYIANVRMVKGTAVYTGNFTPPIAPVTTSGPASSYSSTTNVNTSFTSTNTSLLTQFTNAGIIDGTMDNVLETVGNAQVSTSVVKYGSGSLAFDGTGDWLVFPSSQNFNMGTGNWTVECWALASTNAARGVFQITTGTLNSVSTGIGVGISSNTGFPWRVYHGTTATDTTTNATIGSWQHLAFVRNNGNVQLYLNGTSIYSATDTSDLSSYTFLTVGAWFSSSFPWLGYIDDFRITKGVARYISNFTPPQVALPRQ
jgi:hypothetical protein